VGVFSTRSPHRPANIGLTLAKLEKVEGDMVYLSGIDLVDGTPVLDIIKPCIPQYDASQQHITEAVSELRYPHRLWILRMNLLE
jgi:tRNA (Thr-GGU) A37 N-methylase